MSKHSLTDEEKQRLEQILSDIDIYKSRKESQDRLQGKEDKTEGTITEDNSNLVEHNAFVLNGNDKKRISEIDFQLENYHCETEHLRASDSTSAHNFWKNLNLDEMLKNVDEKLANIPREDEIKDTTLQTSETC